MNSQGLSSKLLIDANQKIKERDYWMDKLSGELTKSTFPYDHIKAPGYKQVKETVNFRLSGNNFSRLLQISNKSDIRLLIILMASLVELIDKYTGNKDIIIGSPVDRQESECQFMNTILVLRNQLEEDMKFKELLMQTSRIFSEAVEHVNYPIEALLYQLDIPYKEDEDFPLFDIAVLLENIQEKHYIKHIRLNLVFSFTRTDECIEGVVEFNSALYKKTKIEQMVSHFTNLLENALSNLDTPISRLGILSPGERNQLLVVFNDNRMEYAADQTIDRLFKKQAVNYPDVIAVVHEDVYLTYRHLDQITDQLAVLLREKGLETGHIAALMVDRCVEMIVGILGILKAGGAYLPVNPENPIQRIRYILQDSETGILFTREKYMGTVGETIPVVIDLQDHRNYRDDTVPANSTHGIEPESLAYVIYTSGSTGNPKGVLIDHRSVNTLVSGLDKLIYKQYPYPVNLRAGMVAPYIFDASVQQIFAALLLGHSLYIVPENTRVDGDLLIQFFIANAIDISDGTPSHLKLMLDSIAESSGKLCLKHLIIGGEALPQKIVEIFLNHFDENAPKITNVYGPAECCVDVTAYEITKKTIAGIEIIPIGKPMPNRQIYIVNRGNNLQPLGVIGEICISGDGVGKGYLKKDELTANKFVENPFVEGLKMYKTGDLARWLPGGDIEFVGRLDHQVKLRGYRVELGEIENQLLAYEHVREVLVIAKTDEDGDRSLYCYFVGDRDLEPHELRDYLYDILPAYMVPSYFVQIEKFPLTPNGKIDTRKLPEPQAQFGQANIKPRDEVEKKLAQLWSEVLRVEKENIGLGSDFFALGGHSLKATTLISKIHKEFNVKVPIAQIFETPVLMELSNYIKETSEVVFVSIKLVEKKEYYALSSAQKRFYFLQQMDTESTAFNIAQVIAMKEEPDRKRLEESFKKMIERHESLRTTFQLINDEPFQKIEEDFKFSVQYYSAGKEETMEIIKSFVRPFDLETTPLMRAGLVNIDNSRYLMMVDMHHIISDGVSNNVLIEDFQSLYEGRELQDLRLQYKDFSEWENSQEQQEEIDKQRDFWLKKFEGELPVMNLPTDFPYRSTKSFEGTSVDLELDADTTRALRNFVSEEETTLYVVLLAIYNIMLSKLCGTEDIVVGTAIAGRQHADLTLIIGLFFNTLALRSFPGQEKRFINFLKETKSDTLESFENQNYGFDRLVQDLMEKKTLARDAARNPLFDTMFSFDSYESDSMRLIGIEVDRELSNAFNYRGDSSKFDLLLNVVEHKDILVLGMDYSTVLFRQSTAEIILEYYVEVLNQVLENKEIQIKEIKITRDSMDVKSSFDDKELVDFNF